jgi:hypothetical protein
MLGGGGKGLGDCRGPIIIISFHFVSDLWPGLWAVPTTTYTEILVVLANTALREGGEGGARIRRPQKNKHPVKVSFS